MERGTVQWRGIQVGKMVCEPKSDDSRKRQPKSDDSRKRQPKSDDGRKRQPKSDDGRRYSGWTTVVVGNNTVCERKSGKGSG